MPRSKHPRPSDARSPSQNPLPEQGSGGLQELLALFNLFETTFYKWNALCKGSVQDWLPCIRKWTTSARCFTLKLVSKNLGSTVLKILTKSILSLNKLYCSMFRVETCQTQRVQVHDGSSEDCDWQIALVHRVIDKDAIFEPHRRAKDGKVIPIIEVRVKQLFVMSTWDMGVFCIVAFITTRDQIFRYNRKFRNYRVVDSDRASLHRVERRKGTDRIWRLVVFGRT